MEAVPLVSVAMITYNHRAFIGQAIQSVLAQKRDFPIEIVISDDCSPDGTAKVIDEYHAGHKELFVRRDPSHNVGMHANFSRVWSACRGKYIALLEGDDWWHSPEKLATQIAFMEANPEYTISGHSVRYVRMPEGQEIVPDDKNLIPQKTTVKDLIRRNHLQTCSVVCRRGIVPKIPAWTWGLSMGDWPLFILHAMHGPVGFIDQLLAAYRLHGGGRWSTIDVIERYQHSLNALCVMRANLPAKFRDDFSKSIWEIEKSLIRLHADQGQFGFARQALLRFLRADPMPDESLRYTLHWDLRKLSERHSLFSRERYQLLHLAYVADPIGFNPFRLMGNFGSRTWRRLMG